MSDPVVIDIETARVRRSSRRNHALLAELALGRCEEAYHCRDWPRFCYWHRVYRDIRRQMPDDSSRRIARAARDTGRSGGPDGGNGGRQRLAALAACIRRYGKIGAALLVMLLATPVPAQTMSWSSSGHATVVAAATLPDVAGAPRYVRLLGGTLWFEEVRGIASANGFFYQLSGATAISMAGRTRTLEAGQALFLPRGTRLAFKATGRGPSVFLQFLLTTFSANETPAFFGLTSHEIYRSPEPVGDLGLGDYVLSLRKVILPDGAPWDVPHHRSGFAVHMVLAGTGAETVNGSIVERGPNSISAEPSDTVYQWSNPGRQPLTYLLLNLNAKDKDAIVADAAPDSRQ